MTPSRPWLGITTRSWPRDSAHLHMRLVGGRPRHARERRARRAGDGGAPRRAGLPGLVLAQPQARAGGNSGRICICVLGRGRAPGLLVQAQLAPRPRGRPRLQELPAGEHHRDHSAGERLADRQGTGQREHRNDVNARLVAPDRAGYPGHRKTRPSISAGDRQRPRGRPGSQQPRHAARQQQHAGHGEQRASPCSHATGPCSHSLPAVPAQWSCSW